MLICLLLIQGSRVETKANAPFSLHSQLFSMSCHYFRLFLEGVTCKCGRAWLYIGQHPAAAQRLGK